MVLAFSVCIPPNALLLSFIFLTSPARLRCAKDSQRQKILSPVVLEHPRFLSPITQAFLRNC